MSDFTQRDMSGVLFKNERKRGETSPDYTGSVTVKGTKFSLAGWIKQGKKGAYMSLAVKPWEDNAVRKPRQSSRPEPDSADFPDDPF